MDTAVEGSDMTGQEHHQFGLPVRTVAFADVVRMPGLEQMYGSLSPLEKAQLGLLMVAVAPRVIVETGVWRGRTTRFLSEFATLNRIPATIYGFDLPEIIAELHAGDPFFATAQNVQLVGGALPGSLKAWLARTRLPVDLALVDANHTYYSVYTELSLICPRLRPGGYIMCHDYGGPGSGYEQVVCAVNDAAARYGFVVLPLSSERGVEAPRKCEAAILHRPLRYPWPKRLYAWRKYLAAAYPRLARTWGNLRRKLG